MDLGHVVTRWMEHASLRFPGILTAGVLLLVGWALGRLLGTATRRLLGRLDPLPPGRAVRAVLRRIGIERALSEVAAALVFWAVFLFFVTAATEMLGLPVLAAWLTGVTYYLPRVLLAVLIVVLGVFAGALARDAVATAAAAAGVVYGALLGRLAQVVVVGVAVVTAIDQIGVESRFLTATMTIALAAGLGAAALAFGLGARTAVSNIIGSHYLRRTYRLGQVVRIGAVEGTIVAMTNTSVIFDTPQGQVLVPAKDFGEAVSILVRGGA
jgi:hypothetical protein